MTRAKKQLHPTAESASVSKSCFKHFVKQEKHAYERDERRLIVFRQTLIDPPETSTRLYQTNNADSEPGLRSISIENYATLEKHRQGCARRQTQTPSQESGVWRSEPSSPWASPCTPASMATEQRMPHETTTLHVHLSCEGMLKNRRQKGKHALPACR